MEELVLKYAEFGVVGVITLLLLTKGLTVLNQLTQSVTALTKSQESSTTAVTRQSEKLFIMDGKVTAIERELADIKYTLSEIKERLN